MFVTGGDRPDLLGTEEEVLPAEPAISLSLSSSSESGDVLKQLSPESSSATAPVREHASHLSTVGQCGYLTTPRPLVSHRVTCVRACVATTCYAAPFHPSVHLRCLCCYVLYNMSKRKY